ncbi:glycosyltransferase family 2 protein [Egbenema bharatensis]|uniref:glycosyltransferase family 2 protein n=1 Tax=Egbenema bharatensis TaxID=3463334 RepID=UPI003A871AE6
MTNNSHPYRATILPVADSTIRPLWSVMIPTYNCAHYLRETLASVLAQDPGSDVMQIEVVDDHSTKDDPQAVVEELGRGRVGFYRQPQNMGYIKNFETCLQRSCGRLVHLLHGDDCVRHGFYQKLQQAFEKNPEVGAAFCRYILMDEYDHWQVISPLEQPESGILNNWLERMAIRQIIQTPSIVVRREIYEKLGGFDRRISCNGEDWEMWVRIASRHPIWYEVEPLALYRLSSTSLSGKARRTGENIRDLRTVIRLNKQHLPEEQANHISAKALRFYAFEAIDDAKRFIARGEVSATIAQILEAIRCHPSLEVIRPSTKLFLQLMLKALVSKINLGFLSL